MRRVRPRFTLRCSCAAEEVVEVMSRALRTPGCPVSGLAAPGRIELHVHEPEQHFWSPQLIVDVAGASDSSMLHGRFGPHPSVWTLYVAAYAACALGAMIGATFGFAEWTMGQTPWTLVSLPVAFVVAGTLRVLAEMGKEAGSQQMATLRSYLEHELEESSACRTTPVAEEAETTASR